MSASVTEFQIAGLGVGSLAREFGTPLYVYNGNVIINQLEKLRAVLPARHSIRYAAKALTNPAVLRLLEQHGAGLDCVSIQEVQLGLFAGYAPERISYTPNNVAFEEILQAAELGVEITLDNLPALERFGLTFGESRAVAIRLNPHIMAGGNLKISTGHRLSKFGISVEQTESVHEIVARHRIRISGLHVHTGSEIKDIDVFMQVADMLLTMAPRFPHLEFVDLGGGFKVAYKSDDAITDITTLGNRINAALKDHLARTGQDLLLKVEPGKFLVSEAGYLLTQVTVVKETPAVTFAGVDTGLNHLIRPMMYDAWHDISNGTNPNGKTGRYTVVGNICETDTFGQDRTLPEVRTGDILVMHNAGAYGYSMSSQYNSRYRPAEVLIHHGIARLIRRRDTMDDLLRGTEGLD